MLIIMKKHPNNWYFSWLLAATVYFKPLRTVLIYFGNIMWEGGGNQLSKISIVFFLFILVRPIWKELCKVPRDVRIILVFLILSWVLSLLVHIEYISIWLNEAQDIFIAAFPFYFLAKKIEDFTEFKLILYKSAMFTVVIMGCMFMVGQIRGDLFIDDLTYSQYNGMVLSSSVVLCLIAFLEEKKWKYLGLVLAACVMLISYGTRMPFLCLLIAVILYFYQKAIKPKKIIKLQVKKIPIHLAVLLIILGVLRWISWLRDQIMTSIDPGFRIIYQIINNDFSRSDGRERIWNVAIEYIQDHPLVGTGIIADRIPIWKAVGNTAETFQGSYAHNIFLEIWMQYGIFIGSILLLFIIVNVAYLLMKERNHDKQIVAIFAIAETFGILLLSGPVFSSQAFWIMLGLGSSYWNWKAKKKTTFNNGRISRP